MNMLFGLVLIVAAIGMIVLARPQDGVAAPFLRVWIVGQAYVMTAMVSAVLGATLVISNWQQ